MKRIFLIPRDEDILREVLVKLFEIPHIDLICVVSAMNRYYSEAPSVTGLDYLSEIYYATVTFNRTSSRD